MRLGIGLFGGIIGFAWLVGCGGAASSTIGDSTADGGPGSANGGGVVSGGVNPSNAGPGGNTATLSCGNATCNIPAQVCCITRTAAGNAFACEPGSTCTPVTADGGVATGGGGGGGGGDGGFDTGGGDNPTVTLKCTDTANCAAGSICCVTRSDATGTVAQCVAGTTCGKDSAQLCDPKATSTGCAAGQMCTSDNIHDWGLSAPFATCGGAGH